MRIFNYSEARQNFATVLKTSLNEEVIITRKDGSRFKIVPVKDATYKSPLDVSGIDCDITTQEVVDYVREGRERY